MANCTDVELHRDWNYLQASDHFYYMCTKWFSDGAVHHYFNPYGTPYEAFLNYMNVLSDFLIRVREYDENQGKEVKIASISPEAKPKTKAVAVKKAETTVKSASSKAPAKAKTVKKPAKGK